jgi:hypothetical protein
MSVETPGSHIIMMVIITEGSYVSKTDVKTVLGRQGLHHFGDTKKPYHHQV